MIQFTSGFYVLYTEKPDDHDVLRRKVYDELVKWKARPGHSSLLVTGQRQVGKTFIVDRFAKDHYEHYVYLKLDDHPEQRRAFDGDLDVDTVVEALKMYIDPDRFVPGSTLIFIDEIQECPRARTALKQFTIDGRYDVIASGSLVGVASPAVRGATGDGPPPLLPVGYEEHIEMRGMDFEEFLWAVKFPQETVDRVKECIRRCEPIGEPALSALSARFRDFQLVGGMPESVARFAEGGGYSESGRVLEKILFTCRGDMIGYNDPRVSVKVLECFDSIPGQLSEGNKKFTYSRVGREGKGRKSADIYMESLLWIKAAGYGNFCYAVRSPESPLSGRTVRDSFKVYLSDTGMLSVMMGDNARRAIYECRTDYNLGALTENVVAECLVKGGHPPRYYRKTNGQNKMELDFVLENGDGIVAVEVKSGKSRDAPSLRKAAEVFDLARRIVLEDGDIRRDAEGVEHYPLFAAAFIRELEPAWDGPDLRPH